MNECRIETTNQTGRRCGACGCAPGAHHKAAEIHRFKVGDAVQTRDGRKARIVCDDKAGGTSIVALVSEERGETTLSYHADGRNPWGETDLDLIPAPRRQTVWVVGGENACGELISVIFLGPERPMRTNNMLCCIRVELEEGRFDD